MLVKSARALEAAGKIRVVALDKTGTLTAGAMTVSAVHAAPGTDEKEALLLAGAVEDASEHPVGQAIAREASARFAGLPPVTGFAALPGAGVRGSVEGREVTVGSPALFAELGAGVPAELRAAVTEAENDASTVVLAGWDGQARAAIVVADQLRPGAGAAVARLHRLGLRTVLLTGDSEQAARAVARQVGIGGGRRVRRGRARRQGRGHPAAPGRGSRPRSRATASTTRRRWPRPASAWRSAPGPMSRSAPPTSRWSAATRRPSPTPSELARAAMTVIRANLGWAFGYNVIAIPLAALGYLNPLFAGIAMSASSLIVVANSLRLRRFKATR